MLFALASCGTKGEKGDKGDKGDTGAQGVPGTPGTPGTTGAKGADADQYYPVILRNENGEVIYADYVKKGESLTYNEIPSSSKAYTYKFTGWNGSFTNIQGPTTITAQYDHSKIYYGTYPQTIVTDADLNMELEMLADDLPTATDAKTWTDYEYYVADAKASIMFYKDIDYDNDGEFDYRGVYILGYRPYWTAGPSTAGGSTQDLNGYEVGSVYWFKYEPIEWSVLDVNRGSAMIFANLELDAMEFYANEDNVQIDHNGGNGYPNNYELSNVRLFLIDNFYNTAFSPLQKSISLVTEVDNSKASTWNPSTNPYFCDNTFDKVFLLSYQEVLKYLPEELERQVNGTDYAKCQGLMLDSTGDTKGLASYTLLRSTNDEDGGAINAICDHGEIGTYLMCDATNYGIRPAMWIIL